MKIPVKIICILALLTIPTVAVSQTGTVTLNAKIAREYRIFKKKRGTKSFATNGLNAYGYFYDAFNADIAEEYALRSCEAARKKAVPRVANQAASCFILKTIVVEKE